MPTEQLDQEFFALADERGRHRHRGAQQGPRPRRRPARLPQCRRPRREGRGVRRRPLQGERRRRWATRRSWSPSTVRPAPSTRGARPLPAAGVVGGRLQQNAADIVDRPRSPSCSSPRARRGSPQVFKKADRRTQDPDRHRQAAHRLRRPGALRDVPRQADARPRPAPGRRPGQPALRRRRRTSRSGSGWSSTSSASCATCKGAELRLRRRRGRARRPRRSDGRPAREDRRRLQRTTCGSTARDSRTHNWRASSTAASSTPRPARCSSTTTRTSRPSGKSCRPTAELRDHITTYKRLSQLYAAVRNASPNTGGFLGDLEYKTQRLIEESASQEGLGRFSQGRHLRRRHAGIAQGRRRTGRGQGLQPAARTAGRRWTTTPRLPSCCRRIRDRGRPGAQDMEERKITGWPRWTRSQRSP